MRLFNHHSLRIFVVLLVTAFVANTVYAGSMMVSEVFSNAAVKASAEYPSHAAEHHCEDSGDVSFSHQSQHQPQSQDVCSHCNHCMACYSMISYSPISFGSFPSQPVLAIAATVYYLAPVNPQPNKPPIT